MRPVGHQLSREWQAFEFAEMDHAHVVILRRTSAPQAKASSTGGKLG